MAAHNPTRRRIVIAMDGSEFAMRAFDWYVANLHTNNDDCEAVIGFCTEYGHIPLASDSPSDTEISTISEHFTKEEEKARTVCEKLKTKLEESEIQGRVVRLWNKNPGHAIVQLAEDEGAECIVTGTRGHGKLRQTLLGSVSQYIVHHSHIPVFVCRDKKR